MTATTAPSTDIRLRILGYHLATIADMKIGEIRELHPISGLCVCVKRTDDGWYTLNGETTCNIYGAFQILTALVHAATTGLHPDND